MANEIANAGANNKINLTPFKLIYIVPATQTDNNIVRKILFELFELRRLSNNPTPIGSINNIRNMCEVFAMKDSKKLPQIINENHITENSKSILLALLCLRFLDLKSIDSITSPIIAIRKTIFPPTEPIIAPNDAGFNLQRKIKHLARLLIPKLMLYMIWNQINY